MHQRNLTQAQHRVKGFTLLEMSVVLAIIAMIVAAILLGKSLVTTSRIQSVITDVDNYTNAVGNFKQAYQSLPGDFAGATTLWGYGGGSGCTNNAGTSVVANGTCDGNSDGKIINNIAGVQVAESFLFWQHLNLAKMTATSVSSNIDGSGGTYSSTPGVNVPAGSLTGSGFSTMWIGTLATNEVCDTNNLVWSLTGPHCYPGSYGNVLFFGGIYAGNPPVGPLLTPDQALSIDAKMDDGLPATGKVLSFSSTSVNSKFAGCVNESVSPSVYFTGTTSSNTAACALIFVMGF